jgi:hypothetical protein
MDGQDHCSRILVPPRKSPLRKSARLSAGNLALELLPPYAGLNSSIFRLGLGGSPAATSVDSPLMVQMKSANQGSFQDSFRFSAEKFLADSMCLPKTEQPQ